MTNAARRGGLRLVGSDEASDNGLATAGTAERDDAIDALLTAEYAYSAAVDAADHATLPSLTDFVE